MATFKQKSAKQHNRLSTEEAKEQKRKPVVFLLENIRSGNNVGSVLRTSDAFVIEEVLLFGYTPAPPHREILKTSLGAELSVPWRVIENIDSAIQEFRAKGYRITALEQTSSSTNLQAYQANKYAGTLVVLGNEVRGVSDQTLQFVDEVLEIPQGGAKQSLNVSVATGIVAWHLIQ